MEKTTAFGPFRKIEEIHKGWSDDRKYLAETPDGEKRLIRVSDISEIETKKYEFEIMKRIAAAGIPMSVPLDFGICCGGKRVYQVLSWCEGEEAKEVLPTLREEEQYGFGLEAGRILRKMQEIEFHAPSDEWAGIYGTRIEKYIEAYKSCGERLYGEERLLSFLENHSACLKRRPMALLHADFQSDNMVISPDGKLFLIDFQGSGVVDPYYAMTGAMVTAEVSPSFSVGQLHSYFDGTVPEDFWEMNAFYAAAENINSFAVAVKLGEKEVAYSNELMKKMMGWYENRDPLIPEWYPC